MKKPTYTCHVEFFCDERFVGGVLRLLTGIALGTPVVRPVTNAQVSNGQLKQKTNGKLVDMFAGHLRKDKPEHVNAAYAKSFIKDIGGNPASATYMLQQAVQAKLLRKSGKGTKTIYKLTPAATA